jgi:hypothetical protein
MKQLSIEKLAENIDALVKLAPREWVLLTRKGRPFAFISDASRYDWEDIGYISDPAFWKMISERRKGRGGIPLEQLKAELVKKENEARIGSGRRRTQRKHAKQSAA